MTDVGCPLGCGKLQRHRAFLERGIYVEPEWVAAAVGAIAAVVVAWQSWETRKNAKAAGEAARAANEAVALARIEEGHTRTLIAEAVRTRIDASTPTLTLIVGKPTWPPIRTIGALGQPPEEVPVGTHFVMPRDAGVPIHVRQLVGCSTQPTDRSSCMDPAGSTQTAISLSETSSKSLHRENSGATTSGSEPLESGWSRRNSVSRGSLDRSTDLS